MKPTTTSRGPFRVCRDGDIHLDHSPPWEDDPPGPGQIDVLLGGWATLNYIEESKFTFSVGEVFRIAIEENIEDFHETYCTRWSSAPLAEKHGAHYPFHGDTLFVTDDGFRILRNRPNRQQVVGNFFSGHLITSKFHHVSLGEVARAEDELDHDHSGGWEQLLRITQIKALIHPHGKAVGTREFIHAHMSIAISTENLYAYQEYPHSIAPSAVILRLEHATPPPPFTPHPADTRIPDEDGLLREYRARGIDERDRELEKQLCPTPPDASPRDHQNKAASSTKESPAYGTGIAPGPPTTPDSRTTTESPTAAPKMASSSNAPKTDSPNSSNKGKGPATSNTLMVGPSPSPQ